MAEANVPRPPVSGEPYCRECGYVLTGLTESSKCPECGRPLVEVLTRPGFAAGLGRRYRSKARLFGLPAIDIAFGPSHNEKHGRPRGFIAIGDVATGVLAIGSVARGVVAIGGNAIGGFALGGLSIGLGASAGGMAFGSMACGGFAIGVLARGGAAFGVVADGGMAIGLYARGGGAFGPNTISPGGASAVAQNVFDNLAWFYGSWPPNVMSYLSTLSMAAGVSLLLGIIFAFMGCVAWQRDPGPEPST